MVPYYNTPTQEGLYRHFRAIAETVDIPQIVYNVPGRTVADLANETTLRLAQVPNIAGVKQALAALDAETLEILARAPREFSVLGGEDTLLFPLTLMGGAGTISAAAQPRYTTATAAPRGMRNRPILTAPIAFTIGSSSSASSVATRNRKTT